MAEPQHLGASSRNRQGRVCFLFSLSAALGAAVFAGTVAALHKPLDALINHNAISV